MAVTLAFNLEHLQQAAGLQPHKLMGFCENVGESSREALSDSFGWTGPVLASAQLCRGWAGFNAILPDIVANAVERSAENMTVTYLVDPVTSGFTIDFFDDGLIVPDAAWLRPVTTNPGQLFDYYDLLSGKVACHRQARSQIFHHAALLFAKRYYASLALLVAYIGNREGDWGAVSLKYYSGEGMLLRIASADLLANDQHTSERFAALKAIFTDTADNKQAWVEVIDHYRHCDPGKVSGTIL